MLRQGGAAVFFSCLPVEREDANETVRLVEGAGRKAILITGDIRENSFCRKLVEETVKAIGRLDVLANNAAFQRTYESPEDQFDGTFRTNVYATFFLTRAAMPKMKPGGVILNTCSIEAFQSSESLTAYASTKAALVSLTKSFSELAIDPIARDTR